MICLQCNDHPGYKAKREPACACETCWTLWHLVEMLVHYNYVTVFSGKPK